MVCVLRLPPGRLQSLQNWVASKDESARLHPQELDAMLKQVASRLLQVHLLGVLSLSLCISVNYCQCPT